MLASAAPARFRRYIEPFAGSACLYFYLKPKTALLGDINAELMAFYDTLASSPHRLISELRKYDPSGADYYVLRELKLKLGTVAAAARFLYLNRFCFNGVYRTNRDGEFNVPRGRHTGHIPSATELEAASRLLRNAERVVADFEDTLACAERDDFVYIDPPYARRKSLRPGEYGYKSIDGDADLNRLACALDDLDRRGVKYLVSYMRSARARQILPHTSARVITVRRNVGGFAATRRLTSELLLANFRS